MSETTAQGALPSSAYDERGITAATAHEHSSGLRPAPEPLASVPDSLPSAAELEQTLQRLVRRMAMLIQAEKCVFMLHDRERNLLVARPPALGFTSQELKSLRLSTDQG